MNVGDRVLLVISGVEVTVTGIDDDSFQDETGAWHSTDDADLVEQSA